MHLELSTNPGMEDLLLQELGVPGELRPGGRRGWVSVQGPDTLLPQALSSRGAHHVDRMVHTGPLPDGGDDLEHISRLLASLDLPELAPEAVSFRVTSRRRGVHPYTSEDVQRAAARGVLATTPRRVDLKGYDVDVRVDVDHRHLRVAVRYTRRSLSERLTRPCAPPVALRAHVAWALLRLACPTPPRAILDPCCGSGTLLLEAGSLWPGVGLHGADIDPERARCTRENLAASDLTGEIRVGDARSSGQRWATDSVDAVVSNPPFGVRLGRGLRFRYFYAELLDAVGPLLTDGGRVVLLATRRGALRGAARDQGWAILHDRGLELGGRRAGAVVLTRS